MREIRTWLPALLALSSISSASHAGDQRYEPLAYSVQSAMHDLVIDRTSPAAALMRHRRSHAWLMEMSSRLAPDMSDDTARLDFLVTVHYEAMRAGLDPQLILGLIEVESNFRRYAVSHAGARGYMQVMPFWVDLIGSTQHDLFKLRTNLRYGCVILRHYLDIEGGDIYRALARYNGTPGRDSPYAQKVLLAWQTRWMVSDSIRDPGRSSVSPSHY